MFSSPFLTGSFISCQLEGHIDLRVKNLMNQVLKSYQTMGKMWQRQYRKETKMHISRTAPV